MQRFEITLRKSAYLLAITLLAPSSHLYQSVASTLDQTKQASGATVPAPSEFKEVFIGVMDNKNAVRMSLERDGDDLTGGYFFEIFGAFNSAGRIRGLEGEIEKDGQVTLTETSFENGGNKKNGEFKGKLDGLKANGEVRLRFSGTWTGVDGKKIPFKFDQLRFDLGGLKLEEKNDESANKTPEFQIKSKLPLMAGADSGRIEKFNQEVAKVAATHLGEYKEELADAASEGKSKSQKNQSALPSNYLDLGYEITAADKGFISVLFYFNGYTQGSEHPNTATESFNFDLKANAPVSLADLFASNSNYLAVLSDYSVKELKKLKTVEWAEDGAGPKNENFHSWNITTAGLKITFDNYEVGPYNAGEHVVVVPYSVLKPIIKPNGLLAQFTK